MTDQQKIEWLDKFLEAKKSIEFPFDDVMAGDQFVFDGQNFIRYSIANKEDSTKELLEAIDELLLFAEYNGEIKNGFKSRIAVHRLMMLSELNKSK